MRVYPRAVWAVVAAVTTGVAAGQDVRLRPAETLYFDSKGAALAAPEAVQSADGAMLIVADTGNRRLLRFERVDERLAPSAEIRLNQLPYPTHVRTNSAGQILALDGRTHRIVRLNAYGEYAGLVELEPPMDADGVVAKSFELDEEDNLFVLDVAGGRILVFDPSGGYLRQIEFPGESGFISDLAVDTSGVVYAVDSVRRTVFVARQGDEALTVLAEGLGDDSAFPTAIVADTSGRLFLADQTGGAILILDRDGTFLGRQAAMGWKEGYLRYPTGLSVADGHLFVADRGNNRVQVFSIVD